MKTFARRERRATDIAASISSSQEWGSGSSSQGAASSGHLGSQTSDPYSFPLEQPEAVEVEGQPKGQAQTVNWSQRSRKPAFSGTQPAPSRLSGTSRRVCFASEEPADNKQQPSQALKRQAKVSLDIDWTTTHQYANTTGD